MLRPWLVWFACALSASAADLVLVGARVYPAPDSPPLIKATVVIHDGRIAAIGDAANVKIPSGATRLDCTGMIVTAGFWNAHVHFSESKWENAATLPDKQLSGQIRDMLTRYGFTSVFDTGSFLANTKAVGKRIEAGEILGPMILSAGVPFAPKGATPYYLKPIELPQFETPDQAAAQVRARLDEGADAIKLFAGSWVTPGEVVPMPVELVRAAVKEAHARGKPVLAHPSNAAGLRAALDGGVDVLTHLVEELPDLTPELVAEIKQRHMAVIPTLKLFSRNKNLDAILAQLRAFSDAGIPILFGTDTGFLTDYDPAREFELMDRAGLTFPQILESLTSAPAKRYGFEQHKGRLAAGMDADIVVLAGDPAEEAQAFTDVKYTIRKGEIIYKQ